MCSSITIPNPIISIKRNSTIFMNLTIKSTKISSIFTNIHRTFKSSIQWGVKNIFVIFILTFNHYFIQYLIPFSTSFLCQQFNIEIIYLSIQILLSLFTTNKRNTIPQIYSKCFISKIKTNGRSTTFIALFIYINS